MDGYEFKVLKVVPIELLALKNFNCLKNKLFLIFFQTQNWSLDFFCMAKIMQNLTISNYIKILELEHKGFPTFKYSVPHSNFHAIWKEDFLLSQWIVPPLFCIAYQYCGIMSESVKTWFSGLFLTGAGLTYILGIGNK